MIDTATGRVAYAVLSFGGLMGVGGKLFGVPVKALRSCPEDACFPLDVNQEQPASGHGFDKQNWPEMVNQ